MENCTKIECYNDVFYDNMCCGAFKSANIIVPLLVDFFGFYSVVDIGCGRGYWLKAFNNCGVKEIKGFDGVYNLGKLVIPNECYVPVDLATDKLIDKKHDLAISLEVAEHLPVSKSKEFIDSLCNLSDIIVFSAAIPGQGGANHVNEQWPEYWAQLFASNGYFPVDLIRDIIWNNGDIEFWYRQNIIVYAKEPMIIKYGMKPFVNTCALSRVHPEFYSRVTDKNNICIRDLIFHRVKSMVNF